MWGQKTNFIIIASTLIVSLLVGVFTNRAYALDLVVSGNGDGSINEVQTEVETITLIEQSNGAVVDNVVDSSTNTGENSANGNTSEVVVINTGNIDETIVVTNEVNSSVVSSGGCCDSSVGSVVISNNGSDSVNAVGVNTVNTTAVSINNTAAVVDATQTLRVTETDGGGSDSPALNVYILAARVA